MIEANLNEIGGLEPEENEFNLSNIFCSYTLLLVYKKLIQNKFRNIKIEDLITINCIFPLTFNIYIQHIFQQ